MSVFFKLFRDVNVELVMPVEQGERLRGTCFRGRQCRQAGNFFAWDDFREFLEDPVARHLLSEHFNRLLRIRNVNVTHRIELRFTQFVGWDSVLTTKELTRYELSMCEWRPLNNRAGALFVQNGRKAPRTAVVTMALRMCHVGHWKFVIYTMYPGSDCGELQGNLTEERGLVFLDWSTSGE